MPAASPERIDSAVDISPTSSEDSSLSDWPFGDPDDDADTSEVAFTVAPQEPSKSSICPFKAPTSKGSVLPPLKSSNVFSESAKAALAWAPKTWRRDLKPMLRYVVVEPDETTRVKYLTWDQSGGEGLGPHTTGDFFSEDDYDQSEPLLLKAGDWNHATICFFRSYQDDEWEILHTVSGYESIKLPTLSGKAIWTEKPSVEWVGLEFCDTILNGTFGVGQNSHRGRLRVVTHEAFEDSDLEMVMKIWPSPMSSKLGLENEMMAYKACDGWDITPEFVGYVTEQGRVIGMLTKYLEVAHKPENDEEKELCRTALHNFQTMTGWQRRPKASHKGNYLIDNGKVFLIDLANVYPPEEVAKKDNDWTQKILHEDFDAY
ncbi:hypothetical protein N8I77_007801 [Diaporthe amygdali]|uniref:Uncharacterized protein n=1 Tax=Phomopsis amygdali TaxID=1214568 RepID=A0AAD9SCV9_PHOAM|nr:hypothetical protein N8I77_007801 [Diaporthe amygdali]